MTSPLLIWLPVIALPLGALLLMSPSVPAWEAMWLLAINVFAGVKWLSWASMRKSVSQGADWRRHLAYFLAWPGLDAETFLSPARITEAIRPQLREWLLAILKTAAGAILFWGVARLAYPLHPVAAAWVGLVGVGLMLHFGVLHVLSGVWRTRASQTPSHDRLMPDPR